MQATSKGIDIGGRALDALLAFVGDDEDRNRVFFRVKGKKLYAAATAKTRSLEIEGVAEEGAEEGEWPVDAPFLKNISAMTDEGSPRVHAIVARLICERTGVSTADLVAKADGKVVDSVRHHAEMPANKQLSFQQIHKTVQVDLDVNTGSWFPLDRKLVRALSPVFALLGKSGAVSFVSGSDELSPVGFTAKGDGFVVRGNLLPPAVQGPGKALVDADDDSDDEEDEDDERQPGLPGVDDSVIEDDEAAQIKASQKNVATEKRQAARRPSRKKARS